MPFSNCFPPPHPPSLHLPHQVTVVERMMTSSFLEHLLAVILKGEKACNFGTLYTTDIITRSAKNNNAPFISSQFSRCIPENVSLNWLPPALSYCISTKPKAKCNLFILSFCRQRKVWSTQIDLKKDPPHYWNYCNFSPLSCSPLDFTLSASLHSAVSHSGMYFFSFENSQKIEKKSYDYHFYTNVIRKKDFFHG